MAATHINPPRSAKKQCLGIPIYGVDSRVIDPVTLKELPAGRLGEIVTHGPQVFLGYWNKPEARRRSAFLEIDGKDFLRTGDLGCVDEDGYFFMVDRLKRMINASGFKVWPSEVETLMYQHPGGARGVCHRRKRCAPRRDREGARRARPEWRGRVDEAGTHRLVPREHGRLQGAAHHRLRRRAAEVRQRQDPVAGAAGARERETSERRRDMKALLSRVPGGPETLMLEEVPEPTVGAQQVRIAVRACGSTSPTCSSSRTSTR